MPTSSREDFVNGLLGPCESARVSRQMGVAGRRLDLAVTEQLADHRQVLAERKGPAGEGMAKIVDH